MKHVVRIRLARRMQYGMGAMGVGALWARWVATVQFSDGSHRRHQIVTPDSYSRIARFWPYQAAFEMLTVRREDLTEDLKVRWEDDP
jgi:hypothetical protein